MDPDILDSLAVFRLTRLILDDSITQPIRDAVLEANSPKMVELFTCPWCMSVWMGIGVVAARTIAPKAWNYPRRVLAFSAVAALIETRV